MKLQKQLQQQCKTYLEDTYLDTVTAIQFVILAILLLLSAFFSSAETALSTVNRVRIRALA